MFIVYLQCAKFCAECFNCIILFLQNIPEGTITQNFMKRLAESLSNCHPTSRIWGECVLGYWGPKVPRLCCEGRLVCIETL